MPNKDEFRAGLLAELKAAELSGAKFIEINSGALHMKLGGYPGTPNAHHSMPTCCDVMYDEQRSGDVVVSSPPKGKGASLTIRYSLPR